MKRLLPCSLLFLIACSSVDQKKFESLYRAAKEIETISYYNQMPTALELVRKLQTEVSIGLDRASTEAERNMLTFYSNGAHMLRLALTQFEIEMLGPADKIDFKSPRSSTNLWHNGVEQLRAAEQLYLGK